MSNPKTLSQRGLGILQHFEQGPKGGFAAMPYLCSAGKKTVGYGHVILPTDALTYPLTAATAAQLLMQDCAKFERAALELLAGYKIDTWTQNQFDALVCLIFNTGAGKKDGIRGDVADSTLMECWARGDLAGTAKQFLVWNKGRVNGVLQPLGGLTRRRQCESLYFATGEIRFEFAA